ncbi:MAG: beta-N-acetylhexosaminidase [Acidobacteria bacterium]|nr:beta-N-acetylhexosaminidase [Acidobacteriota bacterium]
MSPRPLRRSVGRLAFAGIPGVEPTPEVRAIVREFGLGGVVLFARNVESPEQVAALAYRLRTLDPDWPLFVAIDQEGGRVARLRAPFTEWPPMAALGRAADPALAERFAAALARELGAVGITIDFAPVADILTNPANPAIGDRALGETPERVAALVPAIVEAIQAQGLAACAKHFPGHGEAAVDSHHELPVIDLPPDRFEAVEFVPFRAAIEAGVASVMTGHLLVPAFDEHRPATLSEAVVTGLLRRRLGFEGLVFSDDLDMQAVAARHPASSLVASAVSAGCDVGLVCGGDADRLAEAIEGIIRAVESGSLPQTRIDEALTRQDRLRARFLAGEAPRPLPASALRERIGRGEHRAVAEEMAAYL